MITSIVIGSFLFFKNVHQYFKVRNLDVIKKKVPEHFFILAQYQMLLCVLCFDVFYDLHLYQL